jgi:hypothetical protein
VTRWSAEQIIAPAGDDQVAEAARGLARPGRWQHLARDVQACWGECQGSGRRPYLVAVAPEGPVFKCGCPGCKHPCKHSVGLLLLAQAEPNARRETRQPDWVHQWLTGRAAQAAKQTRRRGESLAGSQARARRAARREKRVRQGVDALALWLEEMLCRAKTLVATGAQTAALLALSDQGGQPTVTRWRPS